MSETPDELTIGPGVRRRRLALGLTLAGLARRAGLSAPFLSQVENGRARPSMRSLQRIADALDTSAVQLLGGADGARTVDVVRADSPAVSESEAADGSVRPLVRGHQQLHAVEFTGRRVWEREFQHATDELMYVVAGAVEAEADGESYALAQGDALYCAGGVAHRWRALRADTRVLLVRVADDFRV
ncbi:helix-turn-helix domain-containing protein [Streptomyces sp. H27-D2]|uniref:helix-turn-helix domain-containing protein n=1 Tax=Streptomyces sp. H27-D2 TaxID=3046304 RepID=UPI002DBA9637|nr:helix-turn-helix domain-containing protein [Streptomyces sp. H27-D2]MEC4018626.1 helix-turn-helix domain-containing protein [Streptomyces sp. H27-D2]